ncbi:AGE family epimerase/isomerase [Ruficoccus amylovorans]|uniref:AGE family epimerase/isomerase n=1 Tax=Ruficoccus amylovorans TaxID=1804625 RepID=A0A842HH20_9BACT|nr:AGE family epimerase/isomerase [Ruficoccus amylovorans]MBC2595712.1 AGE family epimerase/isomerase [Ruficoccus amylovorans]
MQSSSPCINIPTVSADSLPLLLSFWREHLHTHILPFWKQHAIDPDGGLNTCIRDDGKLISRDKWLWSQWRAVWVFSRLYRLHGQDPQWLELAEYIGNFSLRHGWDEDFGGWRLLVDADGREIEGCKSIYVDAFAIYALTEWHLATGKESLLAPLHRTAERVLLRLEQPHEHIPHYPYPIPEGSRVHGIPMMFSYKLGLAAHHLGHQHYAEASQALSDEVWNDYYVPESGFMLERVSASQTPLSPPLGTAVVPGHVIEDMWFQMELSRLFHHEERLDLCCQTIRRHLEAGWDEQHGGIFLAIDAGGHKDIAWSYADYKLWWPHTEALVALLAAYEHTRQDWCLEWYQRVFEYTLNHYPNEQHGEWTQRLDCLGKPSNEIVALPVKDPFHLPRAAMTQIELLERLCN